MSQLRNMKADKSKQRLGTSQEDFHPEVFGNSKVLVAAPLLEAAESATRSLFPGDLSHVQSRIQYHTMESSFNDLQSWGPRTIMSPHAEVLRYIEYAPALVKIQIWQA